MSNISLKGNEKIIFEAFSFEAQGTKIGFEKESLRILNNSISQARHQSKLGSSLLNKYITTDFSEAQLEFVTPPFTNKKNAIEFLDNAHHFVSHNIDSEIIWPFSAPPYIDLEEKIPIANYGTSNLAMFKHIYRNGLSNRYGKFMQVISGFHFNYSVSGSFWEIIANEKMDSKSEDISDLRSSYYFNQIRNIYRYNWLIIYLFGASPIVSESFIGNEKELFKKLKKNIFYLPYATSLRMSSYGYKNGRRDMQKVSVNSLEKYISDIIHATEATHPEFQNIETIQSGERSQINENILQIDDEYYAVARAKSESIKNFRTTTKLKEGGVDFIELRSLDLNPFSRIGIDEDCISFLEVFLAYCFIKQDSFFIDDDMQRIDHNDQLVATKGRQDKLKLLRDKDYISLKQWGLEIIDCLYPIAEVMDDDERIYAKSLDTAKERLEHSSLTLSSQILDEVKKMNGSYHNLGIDLATRNKNHYLHREKSTNKYWDEFEQEASRSTNEQKALEEMDNSSFGVFLESYFR